MLSDEKKLEKILNLNLFIEKHYLSKSQFEDIKL